MDRPSDLIEGAILSGRYEESRHTAANGRYSVGWYRLVNKKTHKSFCPLQVALEELGEPSGPDYGYGVMKKFGLPKNLVNKVIVSADIKGSNGIDILRQEGF